MVAVKKLRPDSWEFHLLKLKQILLLEYMKFKAATLKLLNCRRMVPIAIGITSGDLNCGVCYYFGRLDSATPLVKASLIPVDIGTGQSHGGRQNVGRFR